VPVETIVPNPAELTVGPFWGFEKFDTPLGPRYRYYKATVIDPGKAYWVQTDRAGTLTLSSSSTLPSRSAIRIVPSSDLPPPPPFDPEVIAGSFSLSQNFPNPFNPSTVVRYSWPNLSYATVKVYDILGREVAVLLEGMIEPGDHMIEWNAGNLPSGIYYCRLMADGLTRTVKVVLMK
jgi:hypothetical protein